MRRWILQACHSTPSCYLGKAGTFRMLDRIYVLDRDERLHLLVAAPLLQVPIADD